MKSLYELLEQKEYERDLEELSHRDLAAELNDLELPMDPSEFKLTEEQLEILLTFAEVQDV